MPEKVKKEKKENRVIKWCKDHAVELTFGTLFAAAGVAGYILGKDNGYIKGLNEYRGMHIDIMETAIDECGHEAAFIALKTVRDDSSMYKTLLNNPDKVISEVGEKYFDSDYIKKLRGALYDD